MPTCNWINIKGSNANKECGIYTTKQIGDKHFCASHFKIMNEKTKPEEQKPVIEILKEEPIVLPKSLDNGDDIESVIEYNYSQLKPETDFDFIKRQLSLVNDKIDLIANQILKKELGIENVFIDENEEIPKMETF